jgi:predicted dehydrogenase
MSLNIGMIGCGNIGKMHLTNTQRLGLNLVGICDINPEVLANRKREFGVSAGYQDYKELIADKNVQAIVVGTPNRFHAEHAIAALNAGKHVLLEKPMAMNLAEADAIVAAQKKSGKVLMMGMVNRFRASTQSLKRFVEAGRCGEIYSGQTFWYRRRGIPGFGGWFTTKSESGGGGLIDIGVHMLDLALYLMGFPRPVSVSGMTYNKWPDLNGYTYTSMWGAPVPPGKKDVDDYALALIRFDNGATLNLNVSWAINMQNTGAEMGLNLVGDKGGVALQGMDNPKIFTEEAGHLVDIVPQYGKNEAGLEEMKHFVECVKEGRTPMATGAQGRTVQMILDAIYKSAETGREVVLDG